MKTMLLRTIVALTFVIGSLVGPNISAAPLFRLTDLGTLGGTESRAFGINNLGQVVGFSFTSGNISSPGALERWRAYRTAPNAAINPATDNLGTLGGSTSTAHDINDLGQVVGGSDLPGGVGYRAFRTAANSPINPATDNLGTLGGQQSQALAINNSGQVVGAAFTAGNREHPFRTASNAAINPATDDLGTLGGTNGSANDINELGQVTGHTTIAGDAFGHAFRTAPNGKIVPATSDIGILIAKDTAAVAINNHGQVVGAAYFAGIPPMYNAFRTGPNAVIDPATDDIGRLPGTLAANGLGINDNGWVVGMTHVTPSSLEYHAFLHDGTAMLDLNNLLDASGAGWTLTSAADINNQNQIAGNGLFNGQMRAYRLDLVPEPPAVLLAAMGVIGWIVGRMRRRFCLKAASDKNVAGLG
jgi:probable HAF family extracellular repeat protein